MAQKEKTKFQSEQMQSGDWPGLDPRDQDDFYEVEVSGSASPDESGHSEVHTSDADFIATSPDSLPEWNEFPTLVSTPSPALALSPIREETGFSQVGCHSSSSNIISSSDQRHHISRNVIRPLPQRADTPRRPQPYDRPQPAHPREFYCQAKRVLLTFARCDVPKDEALRRITEHEWQSRLVAAVVCQETHEDGGAHLHVVMEWEDRIRSRDPFCFDFIGGKHCNIKPVKNGIKAVLRYQTKQDTNPAVWGISLAEIIMPTARRQLVQQVKAGNDAPSIWATHPELALQYASSLEKVISYQTIAAAREQVKEWVPPPVEELSSGGTKEVCTWLRDNIGVTRQHKQKQLWIYGPTGLGKTYLLLELAKRLNVYVMPTNDNGNMNDYQDDTYGLVVVDEYTGQLPYSVLNAFVEGAPFAVKKKGYQGMKHTNPPVLVTSNMSPREAYPKLSNALLETVLARFYVLHLTERLDVQWPIQ